MFWSGFIIGVFVGCTVGIVVVAMCKVSSGNQEA